MNESLPYELASGQTRVILLDKDIFRLHMINEIDVLSRDPSLGDMIKLAIVDGNVEDLLSHSYEDLADIGTYLNDLLDHNTQQSWSPIMTLHEFTRCRGRDMSRDIVLPIIKREEERIVLTNIALFHDDEMVGQASPREGFFLKSLRGEPTAYQYETTIKKENLNKSGMNKFLENESTDQDVKVVMKIIKNKAKVKLINPHNIEFNVGINMDIDIQEISEPYQFDKPEAVVAIKKQLDIELSNQLQEFLNKLKAVNSDCIGFKEVYRSQVSQAQLKSTNWSSVFPSFTIHGNVKIRVIRTGTLE
ncbi:Ger(x)C family spore germination C-terminal domain-containing protein [Paenibacillus sp. D2_2]|uniref:Ger(x)C family spore germination C-terminal domain-containing protein n=1 Tax=Paenibacillus sp. D2_2 TaxID=3073092 RepID=UPI0028161C38|nr:Ger(x)C family spore germination C-terminal domain-containing protein [Paenibacillus sp. D2_2]WMT43039.1 Ger(x)C family spore germination C-terminal domain-containing protein [Paenibacillus sp. D2_2]